MIKILLIEDDYQLSKNIAEVLQAENIQVETVFDGSLAERLLQKNTYDCIIMDINLPNKNGYLLCKDFRTFNQHTPVLMLTAFGELEDKIKGFDCGADDYLTKPFYMRELLLRIQALIKRSNRINTATNQQEHIYIADDIVLDDLQKKVSRAGQEIILTPREYQILFQLIKNAGEIISKQKLIKEIWGQVFDSNTTNTIEVYVNFLRNKLDKPFQKQSIKTKIGYGYYLDITSNEN